MYSGCGAENKPIAIWEVRYFRPGMLKYHQTVGDKGTVKFYSNCIEIDCRNLFFTFEIDSYTRVSKTFYKLKRKSTDESFNYMEIREMINGYERGSFQIYLCLLDDNDISQNTVILTCRPYKQ